MKFATLLRYIRQKQGLTTAEISSRISVVSTTYYAWERDKFKPNVASLRNLKKPWRFRPAVFSFSTTEKT